MKKLLVVLCAAFVLAGCSGGSDEGAVKKTCTAEQQGIIITMDLEGSGDTLTKVSMNINAPYSAMAAQGLTKEMIDSVGEEGKETASDTMKDVMLKSLDLNEDDYDVTASFDDEGWKMSVSAEAGIFEQTFNASSMDDMVKELSDGGFTCK